MRRHSEAFWRFRRQVARRRRDFLRSEKGRDLVYPPVGTAWFPSHREQARCEAFVVLFVAELETYWETVVADALESYTQRFAASGLQDCGAAEEYIGKIVQQSRQWQKNNNANWSRIEGYFCFVGLNKGKFPDQLWDHVEAVVSQRGDIVHKSLGIRTVTDPRLTIDHVSKAIDKIAIFDRDYVNWMCRTKDELERLALIQTRFLAGIGTVGY